MTDPVEVIARLVDPCAWFEWGYVLPLNQERRELARQTARAVLSALEGEGMVVVPKAAGTVFISGELEGNSVTECVATTSARRAAERS
jgi:hypothetical protein